MTDNIAKHQPSNIEKKLALSNRKQTKTFCAYVQIEQMWNNYNQSTAIIVLMKNLLCSKPINHTSLERHEGE